MTDLPIERIARVIKHSGYDITVTDEYRFKISGPDYDKDEYPADTLSAAKRKIDDHIKTLHKQQQIRKRLNLKLRNRAGVLVTMRGFHAKNGNMLSTPDVPRYTDVYPDVPWIVEALAKRAELNTAMNKIDGESRPFGLKSNQYGHRDADAYERELNKWLDELKVKTAAAIKRVQDAIPARGNLAADTRITNPNQQGI